MIVELTQNSDMQAWQLKVTGDIEAPPEHTYGVDPSGPPKEWHCELNVNVNEIGATNEVRRWFTEHKFGFLEPIWLFGLWESAKSFVPKYEKTRIKCLKYSESKVQGVTFETERGSVLCHMLYYPMEIQEMCRHGENIFFQDLAQLKEYQKQLRSTIEMLEKEKPEKMFEPFE